MKKTALITVFIICFSITAIALEKLQNSAGTVINPATSDNQTSGNQKTQVTSMPTVTVNVGTVGTVATEPTLTNIAASALSILSNQTNGNQKTLLTDLSGNTAIGGLLNSDNVTAAAIAFLMRSYLYGFDGSTWDRLRGDSANGLDVDITRTATSHGKTVLYTMVSQVSAGTTTIVTASASNKHKIVGVTLSMDAAGTLKFSDSSGDLTGALPLAANTPYTLPTSLIPYFETGAVNRLVSLTTTTGKAFGVVQYITEP